MVEQAGNPLSTQAGVGFHKRRTETKFEKSNGRKVFDFSDILALFGLFGLFDFSGCLALFGLFGLFDFSGFLALFRLFGLLGFLTFRLFGLFGTFRIACSGFLALFGRFGLLSGTFRTVTLFDFSCTCGTARFSTFRVRLFVSGFSRFFTFVYFSCLLSFLVVQVFDWALADSIVTRSFLDSVIVSSVVVVARSGLPALADGGFFLP